MYLVHISLRRIRFFAIGNVMPNLSRSEEAVAARTKHAWLESARLRHSYPTITPTELAAAYDVVTREKYPLTAERIKTAVEEARAAAARDKRLQPLPLIPVMPPTQENLAAQTAVNLRPPTDLSRPPNASMQVSGRRKTRRHRKTRGRRILRRKTSRRKQ
jgi:hypothetical protein